MANFFLDNDDIQFLFHHIDLAELARLQEDNFVHAADDPSGYAPLTRPTRSITIAACWRSSARWPPKWSPRTPSRSTARGTR